ncbi:MAG: branched-chain amino acid ABC transporter permease [Alphaproteobacteria bacterium]|nr:branched-chain amino acid ABC transporter permease [Alphaproteobacteria bacterium]
MPARASSAMLTVLAAAILGYAAYRPTSFVVTVITWIAVRSIVAASMRFVMLIGEINVASIGFVGMGAYAAGLATATWHWPIFAALLLGAVVAAAGAAMFGFITLRTRGAYFLLVGFSFTEVMRLLYTQVEAIGGNDGVVGIFPPMWLDRWFPALLIATGMAILYVLYRIERSVLGKLFLAIRGNERIVEAAGINVLGVKTLCLVIASFMVGIAGGLHAHAANVISPGDFGFVVAAMVLAYVKIGGEGHILGAVVGAAALTIVEQYLRGFGALEHALFGAAIVAAMLFFTEGLWGLIHRILDRVAMPRPAAPTPQ